MENGLVQIRVTITRVSLGLHIGHMQTEHRLIAEFVNSIDFDEVAHHVPHHLDLHCLPSSLEILNTI